MSYCIRRATADDAAAILALVSAEQIDCQDFHGEHFVVAEEAGRVTGAVALCRHSDGWRELGARVVASDRRGLGLAGRLMDAALSAEHGPVSMVMDRTHAGHYARWGFFPVRPVTAPARVRCPYFGAIL